MARVTLEDTVFTDPRFAVLGLALRAPKRAAREVGVFRMARVWSYCTERGQDRLEPRFLAHLLGCAEGRVVEVLCDEAQLGELLEDGRIRLCGATKKRIGWLAAKRESAESEPEPTRDGQGRFQITPSDLRLEIQEALAAGPAKRAEIADRVRRRRKDVYDAIRDLLSIGTLIELDDGRLVCSHSADNESGVAAELGSQDQGTDRGTEFPGTAEPTPLTLTPAPALAPARTLTPTQTRNEESELALSSRVPWELTAEPVPRTSVPGELTAEPAPRTSVPGELTAESAPRNSAPGEAGQGTGHERSGSTQAPRGSSTVPKERYTQLYEHWDQMGRERCGKEWRSPGPLAGRHRVREALKHPELAERTDEELKHALAMLVSEAEGKAERRELDPWRWFRDAWSPRVLAQAYRVPNATVARAGPRRRADDDNDMLDLLLPKGGA